MDERAFWNLSPRSAVRILEAQSEILGRQHNERAWLAWHIAALTRIQRMPELDSLLYKPEPKQQSWQEQLAIAHMWAAAVPKKPKAQLDG